MWTKEELFEIRDRAELEANISGHNEWWRQACLSLAASSETLAAMTARIESGECVATSNPKVAYEKNIPEIFPGTREALKNLTI